VSEEDNTKKYLDLAGLEHFLEKFKYAMAHNDTHETDNEKDTTD